MTSLVIFRKKRFLSGLLLFAFVCSTFGLIASAHAAVRPSILLIGDSNTEKGMLTGALQKMLCDTFGYTGSGYFPITKNWEGNIPYLGYPTTFTVTYSDADFTTYDCYQDFHILTPPYPAPNGIWVTNKNTNATLSVPFVGQSLDVYYTSTVNGGTFEVRVDDVTKTTVNTSGTAFTTHKTTVTGISSGTHTLKLVVTAGTVTLQGLDVIPNATGDNQRPVVHNWGNSWVCSKQLLDVDTTTLRTTLQAVNPDLTIVMIGTNDDGLDGVVPAATFQSNLVTYVNRIKSALPATTVLIMSPVSRCSDYLPPKSTAFQSAAAMTGAGYWDMYTYAQSLQPDVKCGDWYHFCQSGGIVVAAELWKQIKTLMGKTKLPTFTPSSGAFVQSATVSLQCGTSDAEIRYTLDGSTPTTSSMLYTVPLVISATTTINARAYKTGLDPSDINTATYTKVSANSLTKIRFFPRTQETLPALFLQRMLDGVFEGTNGDPITGPWTKLASVHSIPLPTWNEITTFDNVDPGYRYLRYRADLTELGNYCNVAEIEFYRGGSSTKLTGTPYGTPGSWQNNGNDFTKVFDGDTTTFFDCAQTNGGYVGIDAGITTTQISRTGNLNLRKSISNERISVFTIQGKHIATINNNSTKGCGALPLLHGRTGIYLVKAHNDKNNKTFILNAQ